MRTTARLASVLAQSMAGAVLARLLLEHLWLSIALTWPQTVGAGIGMAAVTAMRRRKRT